MSSDPQFYLRLADALLLLHFAFVAFVVLGFVVIWIGYFCRWTFVRNFWFRVAHLAAMAVVLAESLTGIVCPLTHWENALREKAGSAAYRESFIEHWFGRLLFHNWSETTFTVLYTGFFLFVVMTFWVVRPHWLSRVQRS